MNACYDALRLDCLCHLLYVGSIGLTRLLVMARETHEPGHEKSFLLARIDAVRIGVRQEWTLVSHESSPNTFSASIER